MNKLSTKQGAQIIGALVKGNSIRATFRMTGAAKSTALKLLADLCMAYAEYQDKAFHNLIGCSSIRTNRGWQGFHPWERGRPESY